MRRSRGGVLLVLLACGAEPWPDAACEAVCRGLRALTLDRVAFENCRAGAFGGGAAVWTAALLRASQSSFVDNAVGLTGGAVYGHSRAAVVIMGATNIGTSSAVDGGGIAVTVSATLDVSEASRIDACVAIANGGGCFVARGAVMTLSSGSVISRSHSARRAGGIFSWISSTVVLEGGCAVGNCTAAIVGGVAHIFGGVIKASDCTFVGCVATTMTGGGVFINSLGSGATSEFSNVDFLRCAAPEGPGGGIGLGSDTKANFANSRFVGCSAGTNGGAIAVIFRGGAITLTRTSITGSHANGDGGGISLSPDCRASIDASTLSDNSAGGNGGAVAAGAMSKLAVFGGTRVECNAAKRGGGLSLLPASTGGIAHTVFADNVAVYGGGVAVGAGATLHLGRAALFSRNVAASDGGAIDVRGKEGQLFVSASCSFVEVTLDWTSALSLDAAKASVLFDTDGGSAYPGRRRHRRTGERRQGNV
ncbi:hypothetical protein M885DRAFT_502919 [Pelagophyceae sp. CCMP2097]|nr:hypothetical protein M885DRAFT_502919 [Pelagophyceae sp. CCMP2097]